MASKPVGIGKPLVAICTATRSKTGWNTVNTTIVQQVLIPSLVQSITSEEREKYEFALYFTIDDDDKFWVDQIKTLRTPIWLRLAYKIVTSSDRIPYNE
eukprot:CAMPEP_0204829308 /NCGR_PEP_ID=MMETSP1346-20131115/7423_1 /ASSEMBLY_ACC=CAM_ASM_000771 /TAXON_ID=215587 /ORGANISM="Aplanochytrium stocchinoi, Strain GSBS06" /LENGTH=98 /DNA_ID=CAMNT_0051958995 /DNA_START=35 /DNA_END=328 /DNA_ORIENTATION=+